MQLIAWKDSSVEVTCHNIERHMKPRYVQQTRLSCLPIRSWVHVKYLHIILCIETVAADKIDRFDEQFLQVQQIGFVTLGLLMLCIEVVA